MLIARPVLLIPITRVVVLDVPLLAWTLGVPQSAYLLILGAKIALDFAEFIGVDVVEVGVSVSVPIFLCVGLLVAQGVGEEIAHVLNLNPSM